MKPIDFNGMTHVIKGGTPDVEPLPAFVDDQHIISCWKLTWLERIKALILGRVWLCVVGGNQQPPVWLSIERTPFENE